MTTRLSKQQIIDEVKRDLWALYRAGKIKLAKRTRDGALLAFYKPAKRVKR